MKGEPKLEWQQVPILWRGGSVGGRGTRVWRCQPLPTLGTTELDRTALSGQRRGLGKDQTRFGTQTAE